ncbi:MAG: hypothetical protein LBN18_02200 [Dysgonamonadaceae bacterium]|jgi:hypothetical protein|nr:hypothetical protein [Dysgonamonadaceae bacterium]
MGYKIVYNRLIPFKGFTAINLCGFIFVRKGMNIDCTTLQHERIHSRQMEELGYVFFYIWYLLEWIIKLFFYGKNSYWNISFEREAYFGEDGLFYMWNRKKYAFMKYIFKPAPGIDT